MQDVNNSCVCVVCALSSMVILLMHYAFTIFVVARSGYNGTFITSHSLGKRASQCIEDSHFAARCSFIENDVPSACGYAVRSSWTSEPYCISI